MRWNKLELGRRGRNVLEPVELGWNELDWVGMGLVLVELGRWSWSG